MNFCVESQAVAALKSGAQLDLESLRAFGSERLAHYKLPVRLEFVPALPRNPAGKVLKFELRAKFGVVNLDVPDVIE